VNYLTTEPTRGQSSGSYSDLTLSAEARLKPFRLGSFVPYLAGGLGLHIRNNDIPEPNIADLYDGVVVGVQAALGLLKDGGDTGRWGYSGEMRIIRAQNIDRTSFRAGLFLRL
jgi:hypothetical protein